MSQPSIVIVGAGLSGLIFARILQVHGLTVQVFEADPSDEARQQGGSLDIHEDTGQIALREAGLLEKFQLLTHVGGEAMRVMDKRARVLIDEKEHKGGNGRPEIDRTTLRQLLVDSLEPGTIRWGRKVVAVRATTDGHEVRLADDSIIHADLVVGADGAWSKVRALLSPVKPEYTGITLIEMRVSNALASHPSAHSLVGEGSLFAMSDNKYIGGHGGDQLVLASGLRVPENWSVDVGVDWNDADQARSTLLAEYSDWAEPLKNLVRVSDDTFWPRPIYALPTGFRWQHVPGVTLLGDAAHLMSPFAGEGANLALIDGADLAREILAKAELNSADLDAAVAAYEENMLPRGTKSARASARGLKLIFSPTAPRRFVAFFAPMVLLSKLAAPFRRSNRAVRAG